MQQYPRTIRLDGTIDLDGRVTYVGDATYSHGDGFYRCLANVDECLCLVEVKITIKCEVQPSKQLDIAAQEEPGVPVGATCTHPRMRCPNGTHGCGKVCGHWWCPDCGLSWDEGFEG